MYLACADQTCAESEAVVLKLKTRWKAAGGWDRNSQEAKIMPELFMLRLVGSGIRTIIP